MIYTFGALHNKLINNPDTVKKMGEVMMNSLKARLNEVKGDKMVPFLLFAGEPDEIERETKLGYFFVDDSEEIKE